MREMGDGGMGRQGDGEMGETRRINPAFPVNSQQSTVNTPCFPMPNDQ
jgi:hypothetical protein